MLTIPSYPAVSLFNADNPLLSICQSLPCCLSPPPICQSLLCCQSPPTQLEVPLYCQYIHFLPATSPFYAVNPLLPSCQPLPCKLSVQSMRSTDVNTFYAVTSCQSLLCCHQLSIHSMLSQAASPFYAVTSCQSFNAVTSCQSLLCCHQLSVPSMYAVTSCQSLLSCHQLPVLLLYAVTSCQSLLCCHQLPVPGRMQFIFWQPNCESFLLKYLP